ncbi:Recombinase [Parafrankia sp. EAN1pec]|uniref:recombinase family protein n=1 Tax=Parafrankia sp. (strain EAN1pec) TaxID=298653 RepID=UPI000054215F|nr:Recombinase [Frankia sp. EAN1pec]
MSDLPIPALPPAPPAPPRRPGWWWRLTHPSASRQARLLADHHAWTTERARQAQIDLVRAGFHLGPVPFGYRAQRVTVFDLHGQPQRRVRLIVDPGRIAAAVVATIYQWRVDDQLSPAAIATRLRSIPRMPSPIDPATRTPRAWTTDRVSRVLANPVYTGAAVWGRTHGRRPVPPDQWIVCRNAHEPIIDGWTFHRAQLLATPGTAILSPHLPPWEFLADPPTDPGTYGDDSGPELPDARWK